VRVEGLLEGLVEGADVGRQSAGPPTELGQADAVLAGDGAAPGDDLTKEIVESNPGAVSGARLLKIHHQVGVDVAITGVAEAGNGQAVPALKTGGEGEKVFEAAARHDNVFVKFGQTGIAEGVGELAADLPKGFTLGGTEGGLDEKGPARGQECSQLANFAADGARLSVELNNEVGAATAQARAARAAVGGGEREGVRQLEGGGQKAGSQNGVQRADSGTHGGEAESKAGAVGRQGQQFQSSFRDNAQETLGTDKKTMEIKAGFVFMRASAQAQDVAAGQDNFQAEDVVAGDPVFEAAGTAGIGENVATDGVVGAAGGVGGIKEALLFDGLLEAGGINSSLDNSNEIGGVDFTDAIHAGEGQNDAPAGGNAAADVAVAGASRRDRDAMPVSKTKDRGDGTGAAGQDNGVGLVGGKPLVAGVLG